jgi:[ribosomal protein S5]-alanine N-acetyltransferase
MAHVLTSERMSFRVMEPADEASLELLDGDPRVRAFFPGGTSTRPSSKQRIEDSRASFASRGFCDFIVEDKASGTFMGRAGLKQMAGGEIEAGYLFLAPFWGQGFATEALQALLAWFKPGLAAKGRVIALAPTRHLASLRVMEKSGMTRFQTAMYEGVECTFYEMPLLR